MELSDYLAIRTRENEATLIIEFSFYPNEVVVNAVAQFEGSGDFLVIMSVGNLNHGELLNHYAGTSNAYLEFAAVPAVAVGIGECVLNFAHVGLIA